MVAQVLRIPVLTNASCAPVAIAPLYRAFMYCYSRLKHALEALLSLADRM
jgi:hypothetical protein